jgi:hypothetical protein
MVSRPPIPKTPAQGGGKVPDFFQQTDSLAAVEYFQRRKGGGASEGVIGLE